MGNSKESVAVLDIGSTGVRMLVAEIMDNGTPKIITRSECPTEKNDIDFFGDLSKSDLRQCIEKTTQTIYDNTGIIVKSLYVSVPNYYAKKIQSTGEIKFEEPTTVTETIIGQVLNNAALIEYDDNEETIVDIVPVSYYADGRLLTEKPEGTVCSTLSLEASVITVKNSYIEPLENIIHDAKLQIDGYIPSFLSIQKIYGSFVFLKAGESRCMTLIVDVGGAITEYSVYYNGIPCSFGTIKMAGNSISRDVEKVLNIPPKQAIKLKYDNPYASPSVAPINRSVMVDRPEFLEQENVLVSYIAEIMQARIEEIAAKTFKQANQKMLEDFKTVPVLNNICFTGCGIINFVGVKEVLEKAIPTGNIIVEDVAEKFKFRKNSFVSSLGMILYIASKMKYGRKPSEIINGNETKSGQNGTSNEDHNKENSKSVVADFFKKLFKF